MEKKLSRDEAIQLVQDVMADRPSGPDGDDVLEALGVAPKVPYLAKKAVVDLNTEKLIVDGHKFPWYITQDGVDVASLLDRNAIATLSFTMFAETVEVIPKEAADPYTVSNETTTE